MSLNGGSGIGGVIGHDPDRIKRRAAGGNVNLGKAGSMTGPDETVDLERCEIIDRFGPFRAPTVITQPKFKEIQAKCLELALLIHDLCPSSKQKSTALTSLEHTKMCANAAIAIHTP